MSFSELRLVEMPTGSAWACACPSTPLRVSSARPPSTSVTLASGPRSTSTSAAQPRPPPLATWPRPPRLPLLHPRRRCAHSTGRNPLALRHVQLFERAHLDAQGPMVLLATPNAMQVCHLPTSPILLRPSTTFSPSHSSPPPMRCRAVSRSTPFANVRARVYRRPVPAHRAHRAHIARIARTARALAQCVCSS